jgi:hypothetical protein
MVLFRRHEGHRNPHRSAARAGLIIAVVVAVALAAWAIIEPRPLPSEISPKAKCQYTYQDAHPKRGITPPSGFECSETPGNSREDDAYAQRDLRKPATIIAAFRHWLHKMLADPVSFLTMALALTTIGLWLSTRGLWLESAAQAEHVEASAKAATRAADAALLNAQAVMKAERPHLMNESVELQGLDGEETERFISEHRVLAGEDPTIFPAVMFKVVNYGNGPAVVKELYLRLFHEEAIPDEPEYGTDLVELGVIEAVPAGHGMGRLIHISPEIGLSPELRRAIMIGEITFFFIGEIKYADPFGEAHVTRFAWRYVVPHGFEPGRRWMPVAHVAYWEYT